MDVEAPGGVRFFRRAKRKPATGTAAAAATLFVDLVVEFLQVFDDTRLKECIFCISRA